MVDIQKDIHDQDLAINRLNDTIPDEISLGFISISLINVKKEMISKREKIKEKLL